MISRHEQLIVALDVPTQAEAASLVTRLGGSIQTYKVGLELYTGEGPRIVRHLLASGKKVFLDLKYHDIPNTVAAAVRQAARLGVSMVTVHSAGGLKMLEAASKAARDSSDQLTVLAVTVLTSLRDEDLASVGMPSRVQEQVLRLASLALEAGCQGVVSSAQELRLLRTRLGHEFLAVTPGVRPQGTAPGDQARVVTPAEAIAAGATHIVVGRPITASADPVHEAEKIQQEIAMQPVS